MNIYPIALYAVVSSDVSPIWSAKNVSNHGTKANMQICYMISFFSDLMPSLPGSQVRRWSSGATVQTISIFSENIDQ